MVNLHPNPPPNTAGENDAPHPQFEGHSTKGHFVKGHTEGGANLGNHKKRRSRRIFTAKVMHDLLADWREHGPDAIAACRKKDPAAYVRVAVSLLPKDLNVSVNPIEKMSDDRLLEYIRSLEESIVAAIASSPRAIGGVQSRAAETVIDAEAVEVQTVQ